MQFFSIAPTKDEYLPVLVDPVTPTSRLEPQKLLSLEKGSVSLELSRCDHVISLKMKRVQWVTFESWYLPRILPSPAGMDPAPLMLASALDPAPRSAPCAPSFQSFQYAGHKASRAPLPRRPWPSGRLRGVAQDRPTEFEPNVSVLKRMID